MAAKTNVVSCKTYTHIHLTLLLMLLFICQKYEAAEECSFIKCILNSRSFISELRKDGIFKCSTFLNISACSDYCMHKYYPGIFSHSDVKHLSIEKFCIQNISTRSNVSWSCIARHTLRLLTCLANISSLISNNVHEDGIIKESCRKSLESSECPAKILLPACGEKSVEAVKDMIQFSIKYFMPLACKNTSIKQALEMPVNYYLVEDFMELARCFDSRLIEIDSCFGQSIRDERDLYDFVCGNDALNECIQFQVSEYCKLALSAKKLVLKLFSLGGITCENPQFAFKHLPSHQSQDSLETDTFSDVEIDENSHHFHLNDEIYTPGNYFQTSKGTNLFCDKMICCTLFLFIILKSINQLIE